MSVRAYDPTLDRFISADPLNRSPLMWSGQPYVYGANNPLAHVDPSGQFIINPNNPGGEGFIPKPKKPHAPPPPTPPGCYGTFCDLPACYANADCPPLPGAYAPQCLAGEVVCPASNAPRDSRNLFELLGDRYSGGVIFAIGQQGIVKLVSMLGNLLGAVNSDKGGDEALMGAEGGAVGGLLGTLIAGGTGLILGGAAGAAVFLKAIDARYDYITRSITNAINDLGRQGDLVGQYDRMRITRWDHVLIQVTEGIDDRIIGPGFLKPKAAYWGPISYTTPIPEPW